MMNQNFGLRLFLICILLLQTTVGFGWTRDMTSIPDDVTEPDISMDLTLFSGVAFTGSILVTKMASRDWKRAHDVRDIAVASDDWDGYFMRLQKATSLEKRAREREHYSTILTLIGATTLLGALIHNKWLKHWTAHVTDDGVTMERDWRFQ